MFQDLCRLSITIIFLYYSFEAAHIWRSEDNLQESPSAMWIPREIKLKSLDLAAGSLTLSAFEMVAPSQRWKPSLRQCVK